MRKGMQLSYQGLNIVVRIALHRLTPQFDLVIAVVTQALGRGACVWRPHHSAVRLCGVHLGFFACGLMSCMMVARLVRAWPSEVCFIRCPTKCVPCCSIQYLQEIHASNDFYEIRVMQFASARIAFSAQLSAEGERMQVSRSEPCAGGMTLLAAVYQCGRV